MGEIDILKYSLYSLPYLPTISLRGHCQSIPQVQQMSHFLTTKCNFRTHIRELYVGYRGCKGRNVATNLLVVVGQQLEFGLVFHGARQLLFRALAAWRCLSLRG
jgi:hypothetical protein